MKKWTMLTLIGEDRPGIVARVTAALFENGCHLGEASMMRLGGNFTIMLMVNHTGEPPLDAIIKPVAESLGLHVHIDDIECRLHQHLVPDVRISVAGADRAGIVAEVTCALAEAGFHILDLESDVAGDEDNPIYIMHIEGKATEGIERLEAAIESVNKNGIDAHLIPIDTFIG